MQGNNTKKQSRELSPSECDVVQVLEFYSQPLTLRKLAKSAGSCEEQVSADLRSLGLEDVFSKKRVAERRKIHALAQQARAEFLRAVQEAQIRQ